MDIPIYTGLWSENLADEKGEFNSREDYNKEFRKAIKQFNKSQDPSIIKKFKELTKK